SSSDADKHDSYSEVLDLSNLSSNINEANDDENPITELIDNFYEPMDIDFQYNPQDFYFQPTDSILYQNEIIYDLNILHYLIYMMWKYKREFTYITNYSRLFCA